MRVWGRSDFARTGLPEPGGGTHPAAIHAATRFGMIGVNGDEKRRGFGNTEKRSRQITE